MLGTHCLIHADFSLGFHFDSVIGGDIFPVILVNFLRVTPQKRELNNNLLLIELYGWNTLLVTFREEIYY
jgi:hypothetical protein